MIFLIIALGLLAVVLMTVIEIKDPDGAFEAMKELKKMRRKKK